MFFSLPKLRQQAATAGELLQYLKFQIPVPPDRHTSKW